MTSEKKVAPEKVKKQKNTKKKLAPAAKVTVSQIRSAGDFSRNPPAFQTFTLTESFETPWLNLTIPRDSARSRGRPGCRSP